MDSINDAAAVAALEEAWERLWKRSNAEAETEFRQLVTEWSPRQALDPISIPLDLLSPLGQERREPTHTLALAYLLDPLAGHGLGTAPLEALLHHLNALMAPERVERFEAATENLTGCSVLAERAALIASEEENGEAKPRTDLWLEIPSDAPRAIIVVENKIDAVARPGQLARYEQVVEERLRYAPSRAMVVKVYLTVWGDAPPSDAGGTDWLPLSLLHLAWSWLPLLDGEPRPGVEFLRLYLATVFQKLVGLRWTPAPSRAMREDLVAYLRVRLGKDS